MSEIAEFRTFSYGVECEVPLRQLVDNDKQPREEIDPEEVSAMADSFRCSEQAEAIKIFPLEISNGDLPMFMIHSGHRRVLAARLNKQETIRAIIIPRQDAAVRRIGAYVSNLVVDLTAKEHYRELSWMRDELKMSIDDIVSATGRKKSFIVNHLKFDDLNPEVLDMMGPGAENPLSFTQAMLFARRVEPDEQPGLARAAMERGLDADATADLIKRVARPKEGGYSRNKPGQTGIDAKNFVQFQVKLRQIELNVDGWKKEKLGSLRRELKARQPEVRARSIETLRTIIEGLREVVRGLQLKMEESGESK